MTNNKYLKILLFEEIDLISTKSAAQILGLNLEKMFLLLNFLITDLCYSSASCSFTLIPDPILFWKNL